MDNKELDKKGITIFTCCSPMGDSDIGVVGVFIRIYTARYHWIWDKASWWDITEVGRERKLFCQLKNSAMQANGSA